MTTEIQNYFILKQSPEDRRIKFQDLNVENQNYFFMHFFPSNDPCNP